MNIKLRYSNKDEILDINENYSDRRHATRLAIRRAINELLTKILPAISREIALEILVESVVGFQALDPEKSDETSLQLSRLARRVRNKEPIEM